MIVAIADGTLKLPESPDQELDISKTEDSYFLNSTVHNKNQVPVDSSSSMFAHATTSKKNNVVQSDSNITSSTELLMDNLESNNESNEGGGWLSWAWSYVPTVLGDGDNEDIITETLCDQSAGATAFQVEINIGAYFDEFNISFKVLKTVFFQMNIKPR